MLPVNLWLSFLQYKSTPCANSVSVFQYQMEGPAMRETEQKIVILYGDLERDLVAGKTLRQVLSCYSVAKW